MKLRQLTLTVLTALSLSAQAANEKQTVSQVTNAVTLTSNVDYVITSDTPFATSGSVNIENTDHAVVIISSIKPSKVISSWLGYIYINGEQAVSGENCQVKMYNRGAIILPYDKNFRPLTCYTGQNYEGETCDNYTEGSSGGFMKTLTANTLNNQIRSFKLKRGYMVTFALGTGGWGYSRCFIADQEDLEMATLPNPLDKRISSYRIFQWYNAHKAGLASNGGSAANQALNTSWCYDWAQGNASNMPDVEWVPNHIYEDYPSPATCGGVTASCHMKTNNEPRNSSDDHPQDLATILNNWPNLMRTGMRLCSPSSWDGSDYWNGTGFIKTFLDSIDARGWRCDIVDAHGYWNEGNFNNLKNYWFPNMHRPIWISEWIWGASWSGGSGAFASGVTDADILATTKRILNNLNSMDCVERYAYWNSESKAHIYENGKLTDLGKFYASMEPGLGYKKSNEFVPKTPPTKAPTNLTGTYAKAKGTYTLNWNDDNGDMLDSVTVECKLPGTTKWVSLATLPLKDKSAYAGAAYSYVDTPEEPGAYYYRVGAFPIGSKTAKYSDEVSVTVSSSLGNDEFQYGKLSVTNTTAIATSFSERFSETPAIFMGICNNNNTTLYPGNLITSASSAKFNYQIMPWTEQSNGVTELTKAEEIPFMAVKAGNYKYGELDCEVGVAKVNKDTTEITFQQPFPEGVTPVVLAELRNPTLKSNAIAINIWDVTNTGFKAMLQYEEGVGKAISVQLNTCYLAITPGQGSVISEQTAHELVSTDTVRIDTFRVSSLQDSIVYTLRNTYQNTIGHTNIVAGTGENNMYGASARQCTFTADGQTLYFKSPKVFGKCQTNRYPAAAILRKTADKKISDTASENYGKVYAVNIKRQVDGTSTTTAKNTTANSDVLGYIVVDNADNTYEMEELTETTSELIDTPLTLQVIAELIQEYLTGGTVSIREITTLIQQYEHLTK